MTDSAYSWYACAIRALGSVGKGYLHPKAHATFASLIPISHNPLTLRDMASPGLPV